MRNLQDKEIQDCAWEIIGEFPQISSKEFSDKFKAKKVREFYQKAGVIVSPKQSLQIIQAIKNL